MGYCAFDESFPFVAAFIDFDTRHERTAALTKVLTHYSKIVCDLTEVEKQQVWTEKALRMLDETVSAPEWVPVKTFAECCNLGLYTLMYDLLDYLVKDQWKIETLCILNRRVYMSV